MGKIVSDHVCDDVWHINFSGCTPGTAVTSENRTRYRLKTIRIASVYRTVSEDVVCASYPV